jgi:glycosyltransferase involved in cell wall biosynthesis
MTFPAISVVMSVYNDERFVGEAIDSILAQDFADFEFLVIDDRSTDDSSAVIQDRARTDSRIRILPSLEKGRVPALNSLFAAASADWVAIMDSDDVSMPERFSRQLAFLAAHGDHGVIGCECSLIGPDGAPVSRPKIERPLTHSQIVANLEARPLINHNAVMVSRDAVRQIGGYRKAYRHAEDYDLWLRLSEVTKLANLPEELAKYRIYPDQVSSRHIVEQTQNAAIGWLAHRERQAGRADPTEGLTCLPTLAELDAIFGAGSARYVRRRVIDRTIYSAEALGGSGWEIFKAHVAETRPEPRLWRAVARLAASGRPLRAASAAAALVCS